MGSKKSFALIVLLAVMPIILSTIFNYLHFPELVNLALSYLLTFLFTMWLVFKL